MYTACLLPVPVCVYVCLCGPVPGELLPRRPARYFPRAARLDKSGVCQGRSPWRPAGITRGPWGYSGCHRGYSECQPDSIMFRTPSGPGTCSLSPTLVKTRQASSTEPLVLLQCIIHHSSAEGTRGAPGCSGRRRPWAGHGGRRHAVRSDGRCPLIVALVSHDWPGEPEATGRAGLDIPVLLSVRYRSAPAI